MLIPMLIEHPEAIGPVLQHTPGFVWFLVAGLTVLGVTQMRPRRARMTRVTALPIAMTFLSLWGIVSAFGSSPAFGYTMLVWMLVAATAFAMIGMTAPPQGTTYDAATRTFQLPGSVVPLVLIAAIFLTRYVVNVDIAMDPALVRNGQYAMIVGALYGLSSGIFLGRAARLWRLAAERSGAGFLLQRDPW